MSKIKLNYTFLHPHNSRINPTLASSKCSVCTFILSVVTGFRCRWFSRVSGLVKLEPEIYLLSADADTVRLIRKPAGWGSSRPSPVSQWCLQRPCGWPGWLSLLTDDTQSCHRSPLTSALYGKHCAGSPETEGLVHLIRRPQTPDQWRHLCRASTSTADSGLCRTSGLGHYYVMWLWPQYP